MAQVTVKFDDSCTFHQVVPYHTEQQAKKFFALAKDLEKGPMEIKERAKKKFNKDCFNKLTKDEMKWLIDSMDRSYSEKMFKLQEAEKDGKTNTMGS